MIEAETISVAAFPDRPLRIGGLEFRDCLFDNCTLGAPRTPAVRSTIENVKLAACRQRSSGVAGAILDDVLLDGLGRVGDSPLFLSGVAFRHVRVRGVVSTFKLTATPALVPTPSQRQTWLEANDAFYRTVDWALDISEAQFSFGPDLHYLPGNLIRRDVETQALVHRATLLAVDWKNLPWGKSGLSVAVQWFLEDGPYSSAVLVAPKKAKCFRSDLAVLDLLRRERLAE